MNHIPINWGLISNPLNWLTIILMVVIGMFAFGIALDWYHRNVIKQPAQPAA